MITAVALPSILEDLADRRRGRPGSSSARRRWIINGYLLVYILTMPLAGRMTDLWGARRPFLAGARRLHRRLGAGRAVADDRPAHRRAARPGGRRRRPRAGRRRPPPRTCSRRGPAAGARGHRGADVPRDGRRAVRRAPRSSASVHAEEALAGPAARSDAVPRPGLALGLLHQRPDRARRAAPRLGGVGRLGHAAACRAARPRGAALVRAGAARSGSSG